MAGPLVWTASVRESEWHAVLRWEWAGARPVAACGHVIRGKVHGRRGIEPPPDDQRETCASCLSALHVTFGQLPGSPTEAAEPGTQDDAEETTRHVEIESALDLLSSWPPADLDQASEHVPRPRAWSAA